MINKRIADFNTAEILFSPGDVDASLSRVRALKFFKVLEDADCLNGTDEKEVNAQAYNGKIAYFTCLDLDLAYFSYGCLFWMASDLVDVTKKCPRWDDFLDVQNGSALCTHDLIALLIYRDYPTCY